MSFSWLPWLLARVDDGQVVARSGNSITGVNVAALTPAAHWVPSATATYDLGSASVRWRTLYLSTSARIPLILDTNGANSLTITATASAVNGLVVTNAATGNPLKLSPGGSGSDANIGVRLHAKGTGSTAVTKVDGTTRLIEGNETGIGFFAATPVAQPTTVAAAATQDVGVAPDQTSINTAVNAVGTTVNAILSRLKDLGLIAT